MRTLRRPLMCGLLAAALVATGCSEPPQASQPPPLPTGAPVVYSSVDTSASDPAVDSAVDSASDSASTVDSLDPTATAESAGESETSPTDSEAGSDSAGSSGAAGSTSRSSSPDEILSPDDDADQPSGASTSADDSFVVEISPREAADRAEIEKAWRGYWEVSYLMHTIPPDQRRARFSKYMTEPILTKLLDAAADADAHKRANYGQVQFHLQWIVPVDGQDTAGLTDCQDQSGFGVEDRTTGKFLTVGPPDVYLNATFARTAAGWRLVDYLIPEGESCDQ